MPTLTHWFAPSILLIAMVLALACSSADVAPTASSEVPPGEPVTTKSEPVGATEETNAEKPSGMAETETPHPVKDGDFTIDGIPVPALYGAIMQGESEMVEMLVNAGADVNAVIPELPDLGSPLSLAVGIRSEGDDSWPSQTKIVEILVKAGADVHYTDVEGETPIVQAVYSGQPEMVTVLIDAGADVNEETAFHGSLLNAAITTLGENIEPEDHLAIVGMLVAAGADVNRTGPYGGPVLQGAVNSGNAEIVRVLIEAGANPSGQELLRHAFSDEREDYHWDIVRMLVEAGADPNEYNDRTAGTALRRATATGNEEAMLFLIKAGANPDDGLSAAIQSGDAGRLQILFDAGASPDVVAGLGTAFLGQAIREDDAGMVRGMVRTLIEAGADPEFVGLLGGRLLMEAIDEGNVEIVRILVDAGADVEAPDSFGYTPLTLAAIDGKVEIVQILINAGADVNAADPYGGTPLEVATSEGHTEVIRLLNQAGAVEVPGSTSAETRQQPQPTPTAPAASFAFDDELYDAIGSGEISTVRALIMVGADVNARDSGGRSMLEWAITSGGVRGYPEIVQILVDAGADVNAEAVAASSLLQLATMYGSSEVVRILTDAGAGN